MSTKYLSDRLEPQNVAIVVWYWIGAFVWAFLYLIVNHSSILATAWQSQQNDMRTVKTQISLGIHAVWSEFSLSVWSKLGTLATHWPDSEDSDQTGGMLRLIWVFAGRTNHFVGFVMRQLIYFRPWVFTCSDNALYSRPCRTWSYFLSCKNLASMVRRLKKLW